MIERLNNSGRGFRMDTITTDPFAGFDLAADPLANDLDLTMPEVPDSTPDELAAVKQLLDCIAANPTTKRKRNAEGKSSMTEKISVRVPRAILAIIKEDAKSRGVGYQTWLCELLRGAAKKR